MEEMMKPSSSSPSPSSFSLLPYDIVFNILARLSKFHRPTLFLVSKTFRSLIASPELEATRTRLGKTEDECLYVCLSLNKKNPDPRWFMLAPFTKHEKLLPMPLFPHQYTKSSTVVSLGSNIYIIGGLPNGDKSKRVLLLDCQNHQWRLLPKMLESRKMPAVDVIDGKIYVIGGCNEIWGEVYDPNTQIWEPKTLNLTTQKSIVPGKLVMGGKIYDRNVKKKSDSFLVEMEEKVFCILYVSCGKLFWRDAPELGYWIGVLGLNERLPSPSIYPINILSVANSSEGRRRGRVTVWWKTQKFGRQCRCDAKGCKTEIWCAEVSLERRSDELWGFVEWSKNVYTVDGCDSGSDFLLDSAVVTIPHLKIDRLAENAS